MSRSLAKVYRMAVWLFTIVAGLLFASDLALTFGLFFVEYKDPTHTRSIEDALLSSNLAPLLHLLSLTVGVMIVFRLKREERRWAKGETD